MINWCRGIKRTWAKTTPAKTPDTASNVIVTTADDVDDQHNNDEDDQHYDDGDDHDVGEPHIKTKITFLDSPTKKKKKSTENSQWKNNFFRLWLQLIGMFYAKASKPESFWWFGSDVLVSSVGKPMWPHLLHDLKKRCEGDCSFYIVCK